mgnify:CR=1 FL=1
MGGQSSHRNLMKLLLFFPEPICFFLYILLIEVIYIFLLDRFASINLSIIQRSMYLIYTVTYRPLLVSILLVGTAYYIKELKNTIVRLKEADVIKDIKVKRNNEEINVDRDKWTENLLKFLDSNFRTMWIFAIILSCIIFLFLYAYFFYIKS